MINFVNKKGEKVMEVKDNGELSFVSEDLKKQGVKESEKKEETDRDEKDEEGKN